TLAPNGPSSAMSSSDVEAASPIPENSARPRSRSRRREPAPVGRPRLGLATPRLPVPPQPAGEIPGAVLEEPPAQYHGLLLQLGPAPVDEGQQHLPVALVAETPRVIAQHLPQHRQVMVVPQKVA